MVSNVLSHLEWRIESAERAIEELKGQTSAQITMEILRNELLLIKNLWNYFHDDPDALSFNLDDEERNAPPKND